MINLSKQSWINQIVNEVSTCKICEGEKIYYEYKDLPPDQKQLWKEQQDFNKFKFYLFCTNCMEYSAILNFEF